MYKKPNSAISLVSALSVSYFLTGCVPALAQIANPLSPQANPAFVVHGNVAYVRGLTGDSATAFAGKRGSFVELPQIALDTTKSFTVMAWVKLNNVSGYQTFISMDGTNESAFFLQLRDNTSSFAFTLPGADGTATDAIANSDEYPVAQKWYHVAGVYDADKHTVSLYLNGKLQSTVESRGGQKAVQPIVVGRGKFGGRDVDFVDGAIDQVQVRQAALTATEIAAIASPELNEPNVAVLGAEETSQPPTLTIHSDKPLVHVSPMLYGLMTEEINHSYDGGLYAELIRNRTFQDNPNTPVDWKLIQTPGALATMQLDNTDPVSRALPTSLKLTITSHNPGQMVSLQNDGYWGVPIKPNTVYNASFYAKASDSFKGSLNVAIENADGTMRAAQGKTTPISTTWHKYFVRLKTGDVPVNSNGRFSISATSSGSISLNLVSLFPPTFKNQQNGFRPDLMERLIKMKPAFLRLPGGNYLEGNTLADYFPWKDTLHGLELRPGHNGPWGYRSTDGMGLMEFLRWCDDCNMEPVLAVYAGFALNGTHIAPGDDLAPFVNNALDEIEYVEGSTHTKWGAQRAADGHPKPFPLHYVEIGNEDFADHSGSYDARYTQFYRAIKAKYPQLQIIATTGVKSMKPDVIDEHYYLSPGQFVSRAHQYDNYDRTGPKIFVGEWASQEGRPTPDLNSAIGDAAWMTGMERNSDIVKISSYAPLFVDINNGASQWGTNLIGYNNIDSYVSPSYYAQEMFSTHHGDEVLATDSTGSPKIAYSVTKESKSGSITLKAVNPLQTPQLLTVTIDGTSSVQSNASVITLTSKSPRDTNTITEPNNVVPIKSTYAQAGKTFTYALPAYSIVVMELKTK